MSTPAHTYGAPGCAPDSEQTCSACGAEEGGCSVKLALSDRRCCGSCTHGEIRTPRATAGGVRVELAAGGRRRLGSCSACSTTMRRCDELWDGFGTACCRSCRHEPLTGREKAT